MLTFSELVKQAQELNIKKPTEVVEEVLDVNKHTKISVGNKIVQIVSKNTGKNILTNKGWIKTVVRDIKKRNNLDPTKLSKIKKYIFSVNCSPAEYLMLGGDATKQLLQHLDNGIPFQYAVNQIFNESE